MESNTWKIVLVGTWGIARGTYLLVVEELDGTEVISDPFSEDVVFTSSFSGLLGHGFVDRGIEPEKKRGLRSVRKISRTLKKTLKKYF